MSEETKTIQLGTDDEYIKYAQGIRVQMVDSMMCGGKPPSSTEDKSLVLKALNDLTNTAIGNKRIAADTSVAENGAKLANEILTKIFTNPDNKIPLYTPTEEIHQDRDMSSEIGKIPQYSLVPGETDINPAAENITEFKNRINKEL